MSNADRSREFYRIDPKSMLGISCAVAKKIRAASNLSAVVPLGADHVILITLIEKERGLGDVVRFESHFMAEIYHREGQFVISDSKDDGVREFLEEILKEATR